MLISRRHFLALFGSSSAAMLACDGFSEGRPPDPVGGAGGEGGIGGNGGGGGTGGGPPKPGGIIEPTGVTNKVMWVQGAACAGCSVSFLNLLAEQPPETVEDVLLEVVLLGYHPTLMTPTGEAAAAQAEALYAEGDYLLVVEGGVPTAFDGHACHAWTVNGQSMAFTDLVTRYSERAAIVMAVGTCASFGGVAATGPNPTGVQSVGEFTGLTTLNIPGCPPHPAWIAWGMTQLIAQQPIQIDADGRPFELFNQRLHDTCQRLGRDKANLLGVDDLCVQLNGCRGQICWSPCPRFPWNNDANWCIDANAPCIGCTEPAFPEVGLYESIAPTEE